MERHLATVWESIADTIGDRDAIVHGDRRVTWAQFDDRAARLAAAFAGLDLVPGERVALYLYNSPEYVEAAAAALKQRLVPVNVNYRYLDEELRYLLEDSDARVIVFHASLAERVARVAPRVPRLRLLVQVSEPSDASGAGLVDGAHDYESLLAANEPAPRITRDEDDRTMLYTGGTTGMPKGVLGRVRGGVDSAMTAVPVFVGMAPLDTPDELAPAAARLAAEGRQLVALPACPLMHGTGWGIGFMPTFTFGGCGVLCTSRGLDADEVWGLVQRERAQSLTIVGDAFARPLLRALQDGPARDVASLQLIMSAGAMFSQEVKAGLLDLVPKAAIVDYIAASEGMMGMSVSSKGRIAPTGRFTPSANVHVVRDDGSDVMPGSGEVGVVMIRGSAPDGYHNDAVKTAATFPLVDGERVSIPGDHATVDADGAIVLLGRGSQCINTGGEKVYAEEVEEAVKRHARVDDCLVFGVPDERFGERVVAVASRATSRQGDDDGDHGDGGEGGDATDVLAWIRTQLAAYKVPRDLVWLAAVPRAPNGKADYKGARKSYEAARTG